MRTAQIGKEQEWGCRHRLHHSDGVGGRNRVLTTMRHDARPVTTGQIVPSKVQRRPFGTTSRSSQLHSRKTDDLAAGIQASGSPWEVSILFRGWLIFPVIVEEHKSMSRRVWYLELPVMPFDRLKARLSLTTSFFSIAHALSYTTSAYSTSCAWSLPLL